MPIQNKRSDTPGARANLVPGGVGFNRADGKLLLRGGLKKIEVDVEQWRAQAPPKTENYGSVLIRSGAGFAWDQSLIPSGQVGGVVSVDAPPEGYSVPGFYPTAPGSTFIFSTNVVLIEPFWVASDEITVMEIAVKLEQALFGSMRVGLAKETPNGMVMISDTLLQGLGVGVSSSSVEVVLERGVYWAMAWAQASPQITSITGSRFNQSFTVDPGNGEKGFLRRYTSLGNMQSGLFAGGLVLTKLVTPWPGEDRSILLRWS